jgi:exodeoxyribonuclease VII small subunit
MTKEKKVSFTQAYKNFEKLSEEIENNQDLSIEDQLDKIEEATKLYKICIKYLEETKNKIVTINKNIEDVEL